MQSSTSYSQVIRMIENTFIYIKTLQTNTIVMRPTWTRRSTDRLMKVENEIVSLWNLCTKIVKLQYNSVYSD